MNGDCVDDRCQWEERFLGRPCTLRRGVTIPILVLLGGWFAYVQFDHPTGPREERVESSDAFLSDVAIPEPLWTVAEKPDASRVFSDYTCYREFLGKERLLQGVLITKARSENGRFLYHAFPPLDDPNTFSQLIVLLPDLASVRAHPQPPFGRTQVYVFPAVQLVSRSAAERLLSSEFFRPTNLEEW
jgi:hypothetical protein